MITVSLIILTRYIPYYWTRQSLICQALQVTILRSREEGLYMHRVISWLLVGLNGRRHLVHTMEAHKVRHKPI